MFEHKPIQQQLLESSTLYEKQQHSKKKIIAVQLEESSPEKQLHDEGLLCVKDITLLNIVPC